MARNSRELTVAKRRFPRLPLVKIEWAQVWRARRPREELDFAPPQKTCWCVGWCVMRGVVFLPPPARCVRAKARHAMWQIRVFQLSNVTLCVDANALFDETRRENDAVHDRGAHHGAWVALAVLVDAHVGIEICLSCISSMSSRHPNRTVLARPSVIPAAELLVGEHHVRQVQGLQNAVCNGPRARPRAAARHGKSSIVPGGFPPSVSAHGSTVLEDRHAEFATTSSATCPLSFAGGARSESAAGSLSRPLRSRPKAPSFAASSRT